MWLSWAGLDRARTAKGQKQGIFGKGPKSGNWSLGGRRHTLLRMTDELADQLDELRGHAEEVLHRVRLAEATFRQDDLPSVALVLGTLGHPLASVATDIYGILDGLHESGVFVGTQ